MKSSSIIGIAFLVMAAGLAVYAPFALKSADHAGPISEPVPFATSGAGKLPASGADWAMQQPRHESLPHRHHPVHPIKKKAHHPAHKKAAKHAAAPNAPLPAPTFLPSAPEPKPHVVRIVAPPPVRHVEVIENYRPPAPVVHYVKPKPQPTIYAPRTPSPQDLARQRRLERKALIDAATRTARATVLSTVPNVTVLSADADDHRTYISVVVVEQRPTGTVVENFVFTPGPSALGLTQRRIINSNTSDPFVGH